MSEQKQPNPSPVPDSIKTGDVSGGNVNIGGTQYGNITVNYGVMSNAGDETRQQLTGLLKQLETALNQTPPAQREDAEAVKTIADQAAQEAAKPQPNKTMLKITGEGLMAAAKNLLAVSPIAVQIADVLLRLR